MKLFSVCIVALLALTQARAAHAVVACNNNFGLAPAAGAVLPPRAQLAIFDTVELDGKYAAKINGKTVPLQVTKTTAGPYQLYLLQIDSDATGTLRLYQVWTEAPGKESRTELARYKVSAKAKLPSAITGKVRRFKKELRHSSMKERYDAMAIDLTGAELAVKATLKLRRDAQATWTTLEVPVSHGGWVDKATALRVGQLGCRANYSVAVLEAGVDVEASVTLADGSTRPVAMPARVTLPPAP